MFRRIFALLISLSAPASAIVIGYTGGFGQPGYGSFGSPILSPYTVSGTTEADTGGFNLSGVVEISSGVGTCTGELLSDDRSILTAAHCLLPSYSVSQMVPATVQVYFNYPGCPAGEFPGCGVGAINVPASDIFLDPTWVSSGEGATSDDGNDLAVIKLPSLAPAFATGYSLYTGSSVPTDDLLDVVGVGDSGQGEQQAGAYPAGPYVRQGVSAYFGTCASFAVVMDCSNANVALANFSRFFSLPDPAFPNAYQVEIGPGDSGGPTFIGNEIVGVHEFDACADGNTVCSIADNGSNWGDTFVGGTNATWIESVEAPEPAPPVLLAIGLSGILFARRRRTARSSAASR